MDCGNVPYTFPQSPVGKPSAWDFVDSPQPLDSIRFPNECSDFLKTVVPCLGSLGESRYFTGFCKINLKSQIQVFAVSFDSFQLVCIVMPSNRAAICFGRIKMKDNVMDIEALSSLFFRLFRRVTHNVGK